MRDPKRLDTLYNEIKECHSKIPDWRFMQLMNNFIAYHRLHFKHDGFYIEDDEFIRKFTEYVNKIVGGI